MTRWKGIMKCYPFEEKRLEKWEPPYIVQPKYDGDRCLNKPLKDSAWLFTSEDNPYFSVPHIVRQLNKSKLHYIPWDGELYSHELYLEGGHELIHSIASRTVNLHPRHEELEFHIFDIKYLNMTQLERFTHLQNEGKNLGSNIKIAPFWICETLEDIKRVYDKLVSQGYEGIVVRHLDNLYVERRSTFLMKFKPKKVDHYKAVGWKEEVSKDGIPKGRIGSLTLSSQNGERFDVGAGLNADQKDYLWSIRDHIAGNTVIVHYQHLTNKKIPKGTFDIKIPKLGID